MTRSNRGIYTCVTNGYDRVFPPIVADGDARYLALSDDPGFSAPGWDVEPIPLMSNLSPAMRNRRCKFLPWEVLPDAAQSVYVDGNVRLKASLRPFFEHLEDGYDIVLLRHPERRFVVEEIEACLADRKFADRAALEREYEALLADGFVDQGRLTENNVIVRSHTSAPVRAAMEGWWEHVQAHSGRDQLSLHHFLVKAGVKTLVLPFGAREPNPYVHVYPHFGAKRNGLERLDATLSARRAENAVFAGLYRVVRGAKDAALSVTQRQKPRQ